MLLQLKPLFMGEIESLPIDAELDFSGVEFQGIHPFTQPVRVKEMCIRDSPWRSA